MLVFQLAGEIAAVEHRRQVLTSPSVSITCIQHCLHSITLSTYTLYSYFKPVFYIKQNIFKF